MARVGAGWCDMTHSKAVWYKAIRDGIVWDGAESRDIRVVPGAAAAYCKIDRKSVV